MNVVEDCVVEFHYEVRDQNGEFSETSRDGEPITVLHGRRQVVPGLDNALEDREAGEKFSVTVPPDLGYGQRVEGMQQRVSKKQVVASGKLASGKQAVLKGNSRRVTIVKVGGKMVDVDLNHPLAGVTLEFDVEVISVREADPQEIAHGHVHGAGGHAH
jgi:FKBP-type peptidyl-prolyl cis-trans isomerase SlyD